MVRLVALAFTSAQRRGSDPFRSPRGGDPVRGSASAQTGSMPGRFWSETCSLSELPGVLIRARIAMGLSQTDLARRLNMKPQQVQRYEATNYMSASLARLIEVADTLEIKISSHLEQVTRP